jgi:hypothetical protein
MMTNKTADDEYDLDDDLIDDSELIALFEEQVHLPWIALLSHVDTYTYTW